MKALPSRRGVTVKLDEDVRLALRYHRAASGESVSDTLNRLVRHYAKKLQPFDRQTIQPTERTA